MLFKRWVGSDTNKQDILSAEQDASFYLRNEQLNLPFSVIYFKGRCCNILSMMCMYIETFYISITAPNATMVVYGVLFGVMYPAYGCTHTHANKKSTH